ncbi:hypothetical protein [Nocardioides albus]|uniref:Uncharacterized protein n=1 Tax=Nocardioides albus TaxID=1841 RepID=A0A7W5FBJ9_9ACTN|nr:hypothetical protein [Nocardioides albus]MBB3092261.1 hypothetical protein [Nocardioides albus]GGU11613.1 hypothetical protein GCM10007979_06830 [Nocardioides albus]
MAEESLSPEKFNSDLRDWVRLVTGKADGGAGVAMARSTFYRRTSGSNLMTLDELIRVVGGAVPRTLDPAHQGEWIRKNIGIWQAKWWKAYAWRGEGAEPPGSLALDTASSVLTLTAPPATSSRLTFPRARVAVLNGLTTDQPTIPLSEALGRWLENPESNLFFLTGPSGSGKTIEAREWTASKEQVRYISLRDGAVDYGDLVDEDRSPIVIDDFDLISSSAEEHGVTRPDLSELRSAFGRGGRFVVISKRNLQTERDELAEQLRSPARLEDLGVQEAVVVRVEPISPVEVRALGEERGGDEKLNSLAAEMERGGGFFPATPLVLKQLYASIEEGAPAPRTLWDGYTVHLKHICGQPWDRKSSRIPSRVRFQTYRDIAWDLFTGMDEPGSQEQDLIPVARVSEWLFANLQRDLDITRQRDFLTYEWIADLLDHPEVFGVSGRTRDSVESAEFAHETFYRYFVAESIRDRLRDGRAMALDGARFVHMHLGGMVMSFLKAGFQPGDLDAVARLSVRESLSWMDRLICLYLTEEREDYGELLGQAPERYWDELEFVLEAFESLFLRKVAMYQLILRGRVPVDGYLQIMDREEDPRSVGRERDALRTHTADITEALVRRLHHPVLAPVIPITAYRLGQMGDITCLSHLEALTLPPAHEDVVRTAIQRIKERHEHTA